MNEVIQAIAFVLAFVGLFAIPCAIYEYFIAKHQREWIRQLIAMQNAREQMAKDVKQSDT